MLLEPSRNLDLETLHTFLIVVEQGSLTAAAAILYKTPSAVSYRIKNLEQRIGVQLINRTTHSVEPTEAGLRLVERAQYILDWHDRVYEELRLVENGIEPAFTVVFNNLLYDPPAVASLLKHLTEKFPRTAFNVRRAVYMGVWDVMMHGRAISASALPRSIRSARSTAPDRWASSSGPSSAHLDIRSCGPMEPSRLILSPISQ